MSQPPLHLSFGKVLVAIIDRLELAAIDGDAGFLEQVQGVANCDESRADPADCFAIVPAEIDELPVRAVFQLSSRRWVQPDEIGFPCGAAKGASA
jgi:hypothetical protein